MDHRKNILVIRIFTFMAMAMVMGCGTADRRNEDSGFDAQVNFDTKVVSETEVDSNSNVDSVVITDTNKDVLSDSAWETNDILNKDVNTDSAPDSSIAVDLPGVRQESLAEEEVMR